MLCPGPRRGSALGGVGSSRRARRPSEGALPCPSFPKSRSRASGSRRSWSGRTVAAAVRTTTEPSYFFSRRRGLLAPGGGGAARRGVGPARQVPGRPWLDGGRLVLHLGMTGQLFSDGVSSVRLLSATARASLAPEEQQRLRARRTTPTCASGFRRRGPRRLLPRRAQVRQGPAARRPANAIGAARPKLGIDALVVSRASELFAATRKRKLPIKGLLLNQSRRSPASATSTPTRPSTSAGVRPGRRAERVTRRGVRRPSPPALREGATARSIDTGGSSPSATSWRRMARDGGYQDERRVYARTGEPCRKCGTPIKRIVIGQRSAHYCPACQR